MNGSMLVFWTTIVVTIVIMYVTLRLLAAWCDSLQPNHFNSRRNIICDDFSGFRHFQLPSLKSLVFKHFFDIIELTNLFSVTLFVIWLISAIKIEEAKIFIDSLIDWQSHLQIDWFLFFYLLLCMYACLLSSVHTGLFTNWQVFILITIFIDVLVWESFQSILTIFLYICLSAAYILCGTFIYSSIYHFFSCWFLSFLISILILCFVSLLVCMFIRLLVC